MEYYIGSFSIIWNITKRVVSNTVMLFLNVGNDVIGVENISTISFPIDKHNVNHIAHTPAHR